MTGRRKSQTLPPLIGPDGQTTVDDYDKANMLNNHFANQSRLHVGGKRIPKITPQNLPVPLLDNIIVTEGEVLKLLNSLDINKACGPDNLPPKILKLVALLITKPLTKLFNLLIS